MVGIELVGLPCGNQILESDLRRMAICLHVILVLLVALDVHVAGVPVAVFDGGLRTPMRPDAELGIAIPVRNLPFAKRLARTLEGAGRDGQIRTRSCLLDCQSPGRTAHHREDRACCSGFAGQKERRRSGNQRESSSSGNPHGLLPPRNIFQLKGLGISEFGPTIRTEFLRVAKFRPHPSRTVSSQSWPAD